MEEQSSFSGWAVVEIMGHNREIGYVTTVYFGGPALFRVDQPELPEREYILERPQWIGDRQCPKGTHVIREALQGKTVFVGPPAIFRLTPVTEETAKKAIEAMLPSPIKVVSIPDVAQITAGGIADEQDPDDDEEF